MGILSNTLTREEQLNFSICEDVAKRILRKRHGFFWRFKIVTNEFHNLVIKLYKQMNTPKP